MPGMADIYHQLGMAAHGQERLEDAEDWYRKSLAIREALGDYPGMAPTFWQLSVLAEDRRRTSACPNVDAPASGTIR